MQKILLTGIFFLMSLIGNVLQAQDTTNRKTRLPDIPGFKTLRCDFHLHTVFSDGHVWPTFRVHEAVRDGLDAISLTEHIDFEGQPDDIRRNYNRAYELAAEAAKNKDLLIIRGAEISPRVPPYHNNALFLKDANAIPSPYMKEWKKKFVMKDSITRKELMAPFLEVQRQGAFVFYNHPGYSWWDRKDTNIFTTFHKELLDRGILGGVEVVNSNRYNIIAHRIAEKYNLTMVANSDAHHDLFAQYYKTHRPMTLVFAKEKSAEGIKEALLARRTALYFDDYLVARQPEAEAFFKASIQVTSEREIRKGEHIVKVYLQNNSDLPYTIRASAPYDIEGWPQGQTVLKAQQTTVLILKAVWKHPGQIPIEVEVSNILVSPDETLKTVVTIIPPQT